MDKPDWRKKEDYDYTPDLSLLEWAWEFLRRNPAYREDYKSYLDESNALEKKYGEAWKILPATEPQIFRKNPEEVDRQWKLGREYGKKWHLRDMYDPDKRADNLTFLPPQTFPRFIDVVDSVFSFMDDDPEIGEDMISQQYAIVVFDLVHDLPHQISAAEKMIDMSGYQNMI